MDTIDGMRVFAAVAEEGSFTGAARRCGITTKLASKYVRQLEERLGTQLFNRTTRSVQMTDIGRAYLGRCSPILAAFDELEAEVQERQTALSGPIRMTASSNFGAQVLLPHLRDFMTNHPDVALDLTLNDRRVNLIEEGYDLSIRIGALKDSTLISKKLMDMRLVVVASPDYLAANGQPNHPKALSTHEVLVNTTMQEPGQWLFRTGGHDSVVKVDGRFRVNSPTSIAEMARSGLGVGMIPYYIAAPYLSAGSLTLLFGDQEATRYGVYALYPPSRHLTARVRALIDYLGQTLRANARQLGGLDG